MNKMPETADQYLAEGCGRCPLGGTPQCKVHRRPEVLSYLRSIVLSCGLNEEIKWGVPCYTLRAGGHRKRDSNILIVSAFNDYCSLSFFKGALLQDTHGLLEKPGEHTQDGRLIRFTDTVQVAALEPILKAYIFEAIEVEKSGLKTAPGERKALDYPEELLEQFAKDPALEAAFAALTPGRQRGYLLQITSSKQPVTRLARIRKFTPLILAGKGWNGK